MTTKEKDWNLIHSYTAEQAVADGALIEVHPDLRREAGYRWPVRIARGVACLVTPSQEEVRQGQSLNGRLWDLLWMARIAISNADSHEHIVSFDVTLGGRTPTLWACVDLTSGPAIHIIRPEDY